MALSSKIKVAVLRGGPSREYEVSLNTGSHILESLREMPDTYLPLDIFISKNGEWHKNGLPVEPHQALKHVDVVFNALHGEYGEDGQVQKFLENLSIPFTGSGSMSAAISMHKGLTKDIYNQHGLLTPRHEVIKDTIDLDHLIYIFRNYLHPVIVKPATGGSSIGIRLAYTFPELELAVRETLDQSAHVLVEEFIRGKEATCGVVEHFRNEPIYAFLPIEIRKNGKHLFDYDSKYSGEAEEISPGNFRADERDQIIRVAKTAHQILGLRHYSRSDFIITPRGRVYILETNSLPGFTKESLLPKSLSAVGWHPVGFVDHCLKLALK